MPQQAQLPTVLHDNGVHELPHAVHAELRVGWSEGAEITRTVVLTLVNATVLEIPLTREAMAELEGSVPKPDAK
jgi:hypothetical protein